MKYSSLFDDPNFPLNAGKSDWPWLPVQFLFPQQVSASDWPRITIVTPSFNQGQFIEETIRSVLLQGYPNLEYVIMDGSSTDDSVEIIKKYAPWLAHWESEPDQGQSHAINKGFGRATGDILAWLNADDIYLPGALFHVANTFLRNKAEWIVGITLITDINLGVLDRFVPQINTGSWKAKNYKSYGWLDFVMTHRSGTALPQPASFWSKKAIINAGGVDESFRFSMDHDLYGNLARAGYRPKLIPQTLACFRSHHQQKTHDFPIPFWEEELRSAKRQQQNALTLEEKQALSGYEVWFARHIQWERLMIITRSKNLYMIAWDVISKVKTGLGKTIKRMILRRDGNLKGIVSKRVIKQYIPQRPIIVEAGAHIGLDTEELARYFPGGKIYAFEPVSDLFLQLSERTRPYKNVLCIPVALSDQVGEAVMYVSSGVSDGSSSLLPPKEHLIDHPDVIFDETINVPCTTLDEWVQTNDIEKVDLLWLDMQGHELNALKAGSAVLEKVQAIYTEVNLKEVYEGASLYDELREWLEVRNFKVEAEEIPWKDSGNVLFVRKSSK